MKYAIHEGFVTSRSDGQQHFITYSRLCELYGLNPKETVNWVKDGRGLDYDGYLHLFPRYDGKYELPKAPGEP